MDQVKAPDGEYATRGEQWVWFLVREEHKDRASLLPVTTWDAFAGGSWKIHLWGEYEEDDHRHYRHPQVLVLDWDGFRVEFVGLHLKSKFVNRGESMWKAGGKEREEYVREDSRPGSRWPPRRLTFEPTSMPSSSRSRTRRSSSWGT